MIQTMIVTLNSPEDRAKILFALMAMDSYATLDASKGDENTLWVDTCLCQPAIHNLEGVKDVIRENDLCRCGSGKEKYPLEDARGIHCCYVCEDCEKEKRSKYRVEVMEEPDYYADEPIEPEEW